MKRVMKQNAILHSSSECSIIPHQPTHTTWHPVHSSGGNSVNTPFGKQQQNYGSKCICCMTPILVVDLGDKIGGNVEVRKEDIAMNYEGSLNSFAYTM